MVDRLKENKMSDITDGFGVTVFLPYCTFQMEIQKNGIEPFYKKIEKYFDDAGIENDVEKRITEAMLDVDSISKLMSEGTVDVEQAAMSLAYKFVYAYVKRHMDHWKDMHAIVGMVRDGKLFIDGYKCLDKYLAVVEVIKELSEGNEFVEDDTDEEEITELANNYMIKPTLH